jgi:hypothetical protein
MEVSKELWKFRLGMWSLQEVRWSTGDGEKAGELMFFGKRYKITERHYISYITED